MEGHYPNPAPDAFIFPNSRKRKGAQQNSFIFTDIYRTRMLNPWAEKLGLPKLNFQVLRRTMAILAQTKGNVKDVQTILGHSKPDTTVNVLHAADRGKREQAQEVIYTERVASQVRRRCQENRKFGTLWYGVLDGPQVIVSQGSGA